MKKRYKGYLLTTIGVSFGALATVAVKYVMDVSNIETVAFYWFLFAFIWSSLISLYKSKYKLVIPALIKYSKVWLLLATLFLLSYPTWLYSVKIIGPVNTDFVTLIGVLYMAVLGVVFLKERFNLFETFGAILAILGLLIITFNPVENLEFKVTFILISTLVFNTTRFIVKKAINKIEPIIFVLIRTIYGLIFITLYTSIFGNFIELHGIYLLMAIFVLLLSTVLQHLLMFEAYKYADFSKLAIIVALSPFMVIIYSFFICN